MGHELLLSLLDQTFLIQHVLPLAVRCVIGGECRRERARVRLLMSAYVLQLADIAHVKLL